MISNVKRKDFFYIVVLILTFITVVVGMAFALYTWIFSHPEGSSAVYTGTLSIEYLSGNVIDFRSLFPSERPNMNTTDNVYRNKFRATNNGTLNGILDVAIDISVNEFSDDTIMYILYNSSGDELSTGYINGTDRIPVAHNIYLESNSSEEFVLVIWLNENYENQNTEMRKTLFGAVDLNASQQKE